MNQNRATKTRTQAVIKLAKMMQLELAAAICSDYKLDFKERFSLNEVYTFFRSIDIQESLLVQKIIGHFTETGQYAKIYVPEDRWDVIPGVCTELAAWGFTEPNEQTNKYTERQNKIVSNTFVSTGEVGFSFGSNTHLYRFLIPQVITSENLKYIIYEHNPELSTFPELAGILSRNFDSIIVRDIDNYKFSASELIDCHSSGKTKRMNTTMQVKLAEMCATEYSNQHYIGKKISDTIVIQIHLIYSWQRKHRQSYTTKYSKLA